MEQEESQQRAHILGCAPDALRRKKDGNESLPSKGKEEKVREDPGSRLLHQLPPQLVSECGAAIREDQPALE